MLRTFLTLLSKTLSTFSPSVNRKSWIILHIVKYAEKEKNSSHITLWHIHSHVVCAWKGFFLLPKNSLSHSHTFFHIFNTRESRSIVNLNLAQCVNFYSRINNQDTLNGKRENVNSLQHSFAGSGKIQKIQM